MWIKSIVIITVSIIVLFGLASFYGGYQWRLGTDQLRAQLTSGKQTINPKTYDSRELEGLPALVQRFFQAVLKEGQPIVTSVNLTQQGQINMSETESKWKPFTATQFVMTQRPGFDWNARIQMAPGLSAFVHDAYVLGTGSLYVSLAGLSTMADLHGTASIAQGELLRYFAEMPWYPTALLPSQGVRWEAMDETSARATLTDGDTTVSLVFQFNPEGTIAAIRAAARDRGLVATPWEGRFWHYALRDGMQVPLEGEVSWHPSEGIWPYWRGQVNEINYKFDA